MARTQTKKVETTQPTGDHSQLLAHFTKIKKPDSTGMAYTISLMKEPGLVRLAFFAVADAVEKQRHDASFEARMVTRGALEDLQSVIEQALVKSGKKLDDGTKAIAQAQTEFSHENLLLHGMSCDNLTL